MLHDVHKLLVLFHVGCFVTGLYLEGGDWDMDSRCLVKSRPKVLVVQLPILEVIPIESCNLSLQVWFILVCVRVCVYTYIYSKSLNLSLSLSYIYNFLFFIFFQLCLL